MISTRFDSFVAHGFGEEVDIGLLVGGNLAEIVIEVAAISEASLVEGFSAVVLKFLVVEGIFLFGSSGSKVWNITFPQT